MCMNWLRKNIYMKHMLMARKFIGTTTTSYYAVHLKTILCTRCFRNIASVQTVCEIKLCILGESVSILIRTLSWTQTTNIIVNCIITYASTIYKVWRGLLPANISMQSSIITFQLELPQIAAFCSED